jgi:hypothetical protein
LVTTRRRGTQIFYSLDPSAVRKIESMLGSLRPRPARLSA